MEAYARQTDWENIAGKNGGVDQESALEKATKQAEEAGESRYIIHQTIQGHFGEQRSFYVVIDDTPCELDGFEVYIEVRPDGKAALFARVQEG